MHKGPANALSFCFAKTHHYPATKKVTVALACIVQAMHSQYQQTILCISSHSFSEDLAVPAVALKSTRQANKPLMLNTMVNHSVCDHFSSKSEHANSLLCLWTRLLHFTTCSNTSILAIIHWQWLAAEAAHGITGQHFNSSWGAGWEWYHCHHWQKENQYSRWYLALQD